MSGGQVCALLGDKPSAPRLLRDAIDHNFHCQASLICDPLLEFLRGEAEYAELLKLALGLHEDFRPRYF